MLTRDAPAFVTGADVNIRIFSSESEMDGALPPGFPFRREAVHPFDRRPGESWAMRWYRCTGVMPNPEIVNAHVQPRRPLTGNAAKQALKGQRQRRGGVKSRGGGRKKGGK